MTWHIGGRGRRRSQSAAADGANRADAFRLAVATRAAALMNDGTRALPAADVAGSAPRRRSSPLRLFVLR
jgi:hypothetical protein